MKQSSDNASRAHHASRALRIILWLDIACQIFFWGIPGILAMQGLANLWLIQFPKEVLYVRLLGAYSLIWAGLFFFAAREPLRNIDILRVGVASHFIIVATILMEWHIEGMLNILTTVVLTKPFWLITIALNCFFAVALLFHWPSQNILSAPGEKANIGR